MISKQRS